MKLVMLSDAHITSGHPAARQDSPLETCYYKMEYLLNLCRNNNAPLLQAGDLFQKDRDWEALTSIVSLFTQYGVKILTIPGQHDKYYRTKNKATNLGILENAGLVHMLGAQPHQIEWYGPGKVYKYIINIYGAGWGDGIPSPLTHQNHYNILVMHAPVSTKEVYPEHQYDDAQEVLSSNPQYDIILCGDTHRFFKVPYKTKYAKQGKTVKKQTRWILNTGPMFRYEATEYNLQHKPGYFLWDDGAVKWHEIPHEAADTALSTAHLTTSTIRHTSLAEFTAKMRGRGAQTRATLRERIMDKIKKARPHPKVAKKIKEVMDGTTRDKS